MTDRQFLIDIAKKAKGNNACEGNYDKGMEFIKSKDHTKVFQIILGNYSWLRNRSILTQKDYSYVLEKAKGVGCRYYENGQIEVTGQYNENGDIVGTRTRYYPNGQIEITGQYNENGYRIGTWTLYNKDGSIEKINQY